MSTGNYKNINRYRYDISICTTKKHWLHGLGGIFCVPFIFKKNRKCTDEKDENFCLKNKNKNLSAMAGGSGFSDPSAGGVCSRRMDRRNSNGWVRELPP